MEWRRKEMLERGQMEWRGAEGRWRTKVVGEDVGMPGAIEESKNETFQDPDNPNTDAMTYE